MSALVATPQRPQLPAFDFEPSGIRSGFKNPTTASYNTAKSSGMPAAGLSSSSSGIINATSAAGFENSSASVNNNQHQAHSSNSKRPVGSSSGSFTADAGSANSNKPMHAPPQFQHHNSSSNTMTSSGFAAPHPSFYNTARPASPSSSSSSTANSSSSSAPNSAPPHHQQYSQETAAAMMYAAYQQQQQHFHKQMSYMAGNHNDPRRRAPSLPNQSQQHPSHVQQQQHQQYLQQQYIYQQQQQQPHMYLVQPQHFHPQQQQFYHPGHQIHPAHLQFPHHLPLQQGPPPLLHHPSSHGSFNGQYPQQQMHRGPSHQGGRDRAGTAPSPSSQQFSPASSPNGYSHPPNAPFASVQRPHSPGRSPSPLTPTDPNGRLRTDSQASDGRHRPPQPELARGRTDSSSSKPRSGHSPNHSVSSLASPSLSSLAGPSAAHAHHAPSAYSSAMNPPRLRTDSGTSSSGSTATAISASSAAAPRSASPASSDRAPTPTQSLHHHSKSVPSSSSSSSLSGKGTQLATPATIQRKSSPLAQGASLTSSAASNRSITPTQAVPSPASTPIASHRTLPQQHSALPSRIVNESDVDSDSTAADLSKGHRNTPSNASSNMTANSANSGNAKSSNMFRNKLRKALPLSELNNNSSSSTLGSGDGKKVGRASLTSNSSSSDTSHSTAEPRTPPNGASPVMPSSYAASSATNLHSGRQGNASGGSLPTNTGRRFGLLNSKMNSSTDNISISSTVSSASVMLRKMASFGKLGRKSSVRSLSNLFSRSERERSEDTSRSDAVSEFGVPGAAMSSSKDRKKGGTADPTISHVTVEVESGSGSGMTPAEALVRKHQEKERVQKEAEAAKRRAAGVTSAIPLPGGPESPRSKLLEKEKEKLKNASGKKAGTGKKWGLGAFSRSASSSSLRHDAAVAAANESKASSPTSSAAPSPIFDQSGQISANTSASSSSPRVDSETEHHEHLGEPTVRPSLDGIQLDSWRKTGLQPSSGLPAGAIQFADDDADSLVNDDEGYDDRTPRQSMEILGEEQSAGPYADWDGEPPSSSFFEDDTASFKNSEGDLSHRYQAEPDEYDDDGGHDGRFGQKVPERPPHYVRPAKGILKNARSYSQEALAHPQPAFLRARASSYDAPVQTSPPNQPGRLAALAQVIPSGAQVDGTAAHSSTAARLDTMAGDHDLYTAEKENMPHSSSTNSLSKNTPYNNPSLNNSAPVLANPASVQMSTRSVTGPVMKRNISFAQNLSVHVTWPGTIYDRRGDPATCNRLTPQLAQRIKEELNAFKMEEMEVHHHSRNYTHFFV